MRSMVGDMRCMVGVRCMVGDVVGDVVRGMMGPWWGRGGGK